MYKSIWLFFSLVAILLASCSGPIANPTINDGLPSDSEFIPQANYWFLMNGALESSINLTPSSPKIVKDASNNYYVAFYDPSSGAVVKRWNPNTQTWVQLGSAVDSNASNPGAPTLSIAIDNSGNPVVAYINSQSGYNRLFVKRWDSTSSTWQAVGSVINPNVTQWASYPSLALDSAGNPLVAFVQTTSGGGNGLFVRQWDGSTWNTVGTGILDIVATNTILYPSLAVYDNRPIVSWYESNGNMYVKQWDGANWVRLATRVNSTDGSAWYYSSLAMTSSGTPVLAMVEQSNSSFLYETRVKTWNGTGWTQLGTALDNTGLQCNYCYVSLVLDSTGKPSVVFDQYNNSNSTTDFYTKQWDGSSWVQVGGAVDVIASQDVTEPSLVLDNLNRPVVAYLENTNSNGYNLYVRRYLTNAFASLGTALDITRANQATDPSIARSGTTTMVAWTENNAVYVKNYTGTTWQTVIGALDNDGSADSKPDLTLDDGGVPYIAWLEFDGSTYQTFVKYRSGAIWQALGGALGAGSSSTHSPSIAFDNSLDTPLVAFTDNDGSSDNVIVKRWNVGTSSWDSIGSALDRTLANNATSPSLALDSSGNPVVAWMENAGGPNDIYVSRWDGSTWVAIGTRLDRRASNNATVPSLALDSSNNPVVAWQEAFVNPGSTSEDIYVKAWNGTTWVFVGPKLDRKSSANAYSPSLALNSSNQPVISWHEPFATSFGTSDDVFVKRWNGTTYELIGGNALDIVRANAASNSDLILDAAGNPVVAWQELATSSDIFVKGY